MPRYSDETIWVLHRIHHLLLSSKVWIVGWDFLEPREGFQVRVEFHLEKEGKSYVVQMDWQEGVNPSSPFMMAFTMGEINFICTRSSRNMSTQEIHIVLCHAINESTKVPTPT